MSRADDRPSEAEERRAEDGLPPLSAVIAEHGLSARKSLGQNFLLDLNLTRRIARASGPFDGEDGGQVVEIGPGPGGLTRALLMEGAARVVAVERDERCLPALRAVAERWPDQLTVLEGDALDIDPTQHLDDGVGRIAANLPYNVGTELLVRWLRARPAHEGASPADDVWPPWWTQATLMFQREVAERIVAGPGSKSYGRLSVLSQWRAEARILFDVSPKAFTPPPKVTSSIVQITPMPAPRFPAPFLALERVTAAAFGQRRKMLRSSLKALGVDPSPLFAAAGVAETKRAEEVSLEGFCALARAYASQMG